MPGSREEVGGAEAGEGVTLITQNAAVAGGGGGVTGNHNDAIRMWLENSAKGSQRKGIITGKAYFRLSIYILLNHQNQNRLC